MLGAAFGEAATYDTSNQRVSKREINMHPPKQPGVYGSMAGQGDFVRTERFQFVDPPSQLGAGADYDREFVLTNYDRPPDLVPTKPDPSGAWNPLYAEEWVLRNRRKQEYDRRNLTPASEMERVRLKGGNFISAPPPAPYTLPTERPVK
jgi:hypothetical protein